MAFDIISAHPERLQAPIIQNANAYKEGLGGVVVADVDSSEVAYAG